MQSYCAVAPCICILSHSSLFNLALTLHCATGAYLRHTVVGGTPQPLHNCVSAGSLQSGTPPRGFPSGAAPPAARGGDDDRRRAFPPPRRWWQPCVTPYFATRGRGDMRGAPNRHEKMPPRRRWQAVRSTGSHDNTL